MVAPIVGLAAPIAQPLRLNHLPLNREQALLEKFLLHLFGYALNTECHNSGPILLTRNTLHHGPALADLALGQGQRLSICYVLSR